MSRQDRSSKSRRQLKFIQLELFPSAPAAADPHSTAIEPAPVWTLDKILYTLDPVSAEMVVLNLGLKQRRRHSPHEIASITSRSPASVAANLEASYALLAASFATAVAASEDRDLGVLLAHLSR